jgi:AcrR family transcriptional regulator
MGQRDAEATRARILATALTEFAAHGYSGGRIDRIAKAAESNVRMIYAYFGNKSGLFEAALRDAIVSMAEEVPPRPSDLPAWVGELFDFHQHRPEVLRICLWAQLERPEAASEPLETYLAKVDSVRWPKPGSLRRSGFCRPTRTPTATPGAPPRSSRSRASSADVDRALARDPALSATAPSAGRPAPSCRHPGCGSRAAPGRSRPRRLRLDWPPCARTRQGRR